MSQKGFSGIDIDVIVGICTKPSRKINPRLVIDLLGIKTFRWDQRLQLHNFFMVFKRVPRWDKIGSTISYQGEAPRYTVYLH